MRWPNTATAAAMRSGVPSKKRSPTCARPTPTSTSPPCPAAPRCPARPSTNTTTCQPAPAGRETSIDAALRHRLAAKDKEIAALKATVAEQQSTIELLYGQLDTLHEQIT
ncbi:hypothetical protein [Mycolicibacterium peregrinum]|uniref:hypothetical protein n=1 Tax=Mycolicibacterium peregrinum TaxID=43304 RepID=UPI001F21C94A|nr:hypothetical protein [Mycolicibacterium peregrinum]